MKKEIKFEKIVEWKDDYNYGVLFMLILLSPIIAPIFYVMRLMEHHKENRIVYWRKLK